jgi:hypothetical protein
MIGTTANTDPLDTALSSNRRPVAILAQRALDQLVQHRIAELLPSFGVATSAAFG